MQLRPGKADWGMLHALVWSTHIPMSLSFAMQCGGHAQHCDGLALGPIVYEIGKDHHYSIKKCLGCVHIPHRGG